MERRSNDSLYYDGTISGAVCLAAGLPAAGIGADYVRPCAVGLDGDVRVFIHRHQQRHGADLETPAG